MTLIIHSIWSEARRISPRIVTTAVVLLSMYGAAHAQGGAAGTTPPYMSPGLPSGTYPLMQIGGRGGAHVPMMLKIEARWRVEMENCAPPCGPIFIPSYNWWTAFTVGYGP